MAYHDVFQYVFFVGHGDCKRRVRHIISCKARHIMRRTDSNDYQEQLPHWTRNKMTPFDSVTEARDPPRQGDGLFFFAIDSARGKPCLHGTGHVLPSRVKVVGCIYLSATSPRNLLLIVITIDLYHNMTCFPVNISAHLAVTVDGVCGKVPPPGHFPSMGEGNKSKIRFSQDLGGGRN